MPPGRRSFVIRRAPITPAFRQSRKPSAPGSSAASSDAVTPDVHGTALPPEQNDLIEQAIAANRATRQAQQELHALEPLHRASTGAQRTVLDRRIKRALARLNKALNQFVALEEAMSPESRALLHEELDKSKGL